MAILIDAFSLMRLAPYRRRICAESLATSFLDKNPGSNIIHDPRVIWNVQDIVTRKGGKAIQSKTGHAFIKQAMRQNEAIYGGEMSAHHYFKDFAYCG